MAIQSLLMVTTGVIVSPDHDTLEEFKRKIEARRRLNRQLTRLRSLPAVTQDGV